jgi:hypothetical protein
VSADPAAQLRHELRTPLNHIIGYAELLLEELEGGDTPGLAAGLRALHADARQLLGLLNEALAQGRAGPSDLAAARGALGPPLERIRSAAATLHRQATAAGAGSLLPDLDRISGATGRLGELLRHGGVPPAAPGLPGLDAARETTSVDAAAGLPAPRRGAILVVDDNQDNRDMLARRLTRQG